MNEHHNPQNFDAFKLDAPQGFRVLTVEEAAILTDRESAKTELAHKLFAKLSPEFFSESLCRWVPSTKVICNSALTYRTLAPEPEDAPAFPPMPPHPSELEAAAGDFVESWNFLASYHHTLMTAKGFWRGEEDVIAALESAGRPDLVAIALAAFDGQKIALQTSEASEALEGLRLGNGPDDKVPQFLSSEAEFADVLLRLMDHAHKRGWKVADALVAKMHMNATRAAMHGKAF